MKVIGLINFLFLFVFLVSSVSAFSFCSNGVVGNEMARIISIDDMLKDNSHEWVWSNNDDVELEIRVENRDSVVRNFYVELVFVNGENEVVVANDNSDLMERITLGAGQRESILFDFSIVSELSRGNYKLYAKLYEDGHENDICVEKNEISFELEKLDFCDDGSSSLDVLEIRKISDNSGWNWVPGDELKVSVQVYNYDSYAKDFRVELQLLDVNNNVVFLSSSENKLDQALTVPTGDNKKSEFLFLLNPKLLEGDYSLYAVVKSENNNVCSSLKARTVDNPTIIRINRPENNVIVDSVSGPDVFYSGEIVEYKVNVINLGNEKEERIRIYAYSWILGLGEFASVSNLGVGESREVVFSFGPFYNFTKESTKILFSSEFDYDSERDFYMLESNVEDDVEVMVKLNNGENPDKVIPIVPEVILEETNYSEIIIDEALADFVYDDSFVTGAVVGDADVSGFSWWFWMFVVFTVLIVSVFVVLYKRNKKRYAQPRVVRRYTARLH